jgi:hypothetical protein
VNYLPRLASNLDPPDLCLLSARIIGVSHWRLVTGNSIDSTAVRDKKMSYPCKN